MTKILSKIGFIYFALIGMVYSSMLSANGINAPRAKYNYQMFCQGCHTPDGQGGKDVPKIKNHIGRFLTTTSGREYLVRVPGSANSTLNNLQLAEVLNWIVLEFGGKSTPKGFEFYQQEEVAKLRTKPLFEVFEYRKKLLAEISEQQNYQLDIPNKK